MIHLIIKEERRQADAPVPEDIAKRRSKVEVTSINADIRTPDGTDAKGMPKFIVTPRPAQLHTMAEEVTDMSNIAYAASWDGRSPWLTVLKGSIADLKLMYFGWPAEDQATYEARIEAERLAWEAAAPEREAARIAAEEEAAKVEE